MRSTPEIISNTKATKAIAKAMGNPINIITIKNGKVRANSIDLLFSSTSNFIN